MIWPNEMNGASIQRAVDSQGFLSLEHSGLTFISEWQALRIAELLQWLHQHVPWWHERLASCTNMECLSSLPALTQFDLRKMVAMHGASRTPPHHGLVTVSQFVTSSKVSTRYFISDFAQRMCDHAVYADHQRQKRNPFATHAYIADDVPLHSGEHLVVEASLTHGTGVQAMRNFELFTTTQHMKWLSLHKPAYLTVRPDWFEVALAHAVASNEPLPEIQQLLTYGADATDSLRRKARKWLGASVRHRYTRPECGPIAFQCPNSEDNFHVGVANVKVEVVDEEGELCSPASAGKVTELGRVLVTAMHQYAMPLVRYDTGDYAILNTTCKGCGLEVPTLSSLKQSA
ncbi:MAG: AMP-binding protein [Burkholderiales bacterium]